VRGGRDGLTLKGGATEMVARLRVAAVGIRSGGGKWQSASGGGGSCQSKICATLLEFGGWLGVVGGVGGSGSGAV
jgi:hypothetical protein